MQNLKKIFEPFSTPTVSDALDTLGIPGQCLGVKPLNPDFRLCGPAFTLEYELISGASENSTVGDYIDDVEPGHIVLIANYGRLDCTVWGDILTMVAAQRGVGGTVIDGVCRDSKASRDYNYPVFSVDHIMRTGKGRVALKEIQKPVLFRGITVHPGDVVFGDADGIVVIPKAFLVKVVELSKEIEETETRIRQAFLKGGSLRDARKNFGYYAIEAKGKK